MDSLTAQELKAVKEVKELAEEYGWNEDHHDFKDMLKQVRKKFKKEAGKMNKSTAQEAADEKKPTIKSWEHVAELTTKDFGQAKKLMIPLIPKGEWVSDRFCRGGRSTYEGTPQCKWHRLHTKDYNHFVRLIHYKNKMILQKAVLLGAEEEQEKEEEEEEEEEEGAASAEEEDEPPSAPPPPSPKAKKGKSRKAPEAEAPQGSSRPKRAKK